MIDLTQSGSSMVYEQNFIVNLLNFKNVWKKIYRNFWNFYFRKQEKLLEDQRKYNAQLKIELNIERIPISEASGLILSFIQKHEPEDPFLNKHIKNPFHDKNSFYFCGIF